VLSFTSAVQSFSVKNISFISFEPEENDHEAEAKYTIHTFQLRPQFVSSQITNYHEQAFRKKKKEVIKRKQKDTLQ
jgi:hypothetical protein